MNIVEKIINSAKLNKFYDMSVSRWSLHVGGVYDSLGTCPKVHTL